VANWGKGFTFSNFVELELRPAHPVSSQLPADSTHFLTKLQVLSLSLTRVLWMYLSRRWLTAASDMIQVG